MRLFKVWWEIGINRGPLWKERDFFDTDAFTDSDRREVDRLRKGEQVRLGHCNVFREA